jgi:hypothetical protein
MKINDNEDSIINCLIHINNSITIEPTDILVMQILVILWHYEFDLSQHSRMDLDKKCPFLNKHDAVNKLKILIYDFFSRLV